MIKLIKKILNFSPLLSIFVFSTSKGRTKQILKIMEKAQECDNEPESLLVSQYASHNTIMKVYGLKDSSITIQLVFDYKKINSVRKRTLQSIYVLQEKNKEPGTILYSISKIQNNPTEFINPMIEISKSQFVMQIYNTIKTGLSTIATAKFKA